MKQLAVVAAVAVMFVLTQVAHSQDFIIDQDVPYVPTPVGVVEEMLKMANVTGDDILYDLGCGDGRIVITAAVKYGTHGIGLDIDPDRIAESRKNAYEANVIGNVRFYLKDMFIVDISEATVLTLYLLTSVNLKLRPKILAELQPGTRVVSHNYAMGDWRPDRNKDIGSHTVYFWVVPANISGTWEWPLGESPNMRTYTALLGQRFQRVSGHVESSGGKQPVIGTHLKGGDMKFTVAETVNGEKQEMHYAGAVHGNIIEGTVTMFSDGTATEKPWRAVRNPGTMTPIDE